MKLMTFSMVCAVCILGNLFLCLKTKDFLLIFLNTFLFFQMDIHLFQKHLSKEYLFCILHFNTFIENQLSMYEVAYFFVFYSVLITCMSIPTQIPHFLDFYFFFFLKFIHINTTLLFAFFKIILTILNYLYFNTP